jgi:hypothetical protein
MATRKRNPPAPSTDNVAERLLDLVGQIPSTSERLAEDPHARSREIAR